MYKHTFQATATEYQWRVAKRRISVPCHFYIYLYFLGVLKNEFIHHVLDLETCKHGIKRDRLAISQLPFLDVRLTRQRFLRRRRLSRRRVLHRLGNFLSRLLHLRGFDSGPGSTIDRYNSTLLSLETHQPGNAFEMEVRCGATKPSV